LTYTNSCVYHYEWMCNMAIILSIDNNLLYEAQKDGGQKTQENTVTYGN